MCQPVRVIIVSSSLLFVNNRTCNWARFDMEQLFYVLFCYKGAPCKNITLHAEIGTVPYVIVPKNLVFHVVAFIITSVVAVFTVRYVK